MLGMVCCLPTQRCLAMVWLRAVTTWMVPFKPGPEACRATESAVSTCWRTAVTYEGLVKCPPLIALEEVLKKGVERCKPFGRS